MSNELPVLPNRPRLPKWLRVNLPAGGAQRTYNGTSGVVAGGALHTVCEEARCPNIHDCWARGTATFMIAGKECTRGCRFCHAGMIARPVRERTVDEIVDAIEKALDATGFEEVALLSLSSSDYDEILPLVKQVSERFGDRKLNVSLPSLRIRKMASHSRSSRVDWKISCVPSCEK